METQNNVETLFKLQIEALTYLGQNLEGIATHSFNNFIADELQIDYDDVDYVVHCAINRPTPDMIEKGVSGEDMKSRFTLIMNEFRTQTHQACIEFESLLQIENGKFVSYAQSSGAQYIGSLFKAKIAELVGNNKEWLDEVFTNYEWFEYGIFSHCEPTTKKSFTANQPQRQIFKRTAYKAGERPEVGERKMYRSSGYLSAARSLGVGLSEKREGRTFIWLSALEHDQVTTAIKGGE